MDKMIYYSDNPDLGIKTVTTISGNKEYRKNCKKIKENYYVIDKECFLIGDTWMRIDSGLIAKDWEKDDWFLLKNPPQGAIYGIVSLNPYTQGYFTPNPYKNVQISNGEYALSDDIVKAGGYVEDYSTGLFGSKDQNNGIKNILDHTKKGYNIEDNAHEYMSKIAWYNGYPTIIHSEVERYSKLLENLTFGGEFECQKGYLPEYLQARTGIVICRDGSLKDERGMPGPEFVTIPLTGAKGVQTLIDICKGLSERTTIGLNCSFHLHVGGIDTNKQYVVALFRLCQKVQNELFQMFPYYKANPEGIKHKNYNQKLPTLGIYTFDDDDGKGFNKYIESSYRRIFMWLGEGLEPEPNSSRKVYKHPHANKWERRNRYFWMNAMNIIFSDRNTIEFRLHTPTTNPQKVFNWLFICNAIVRFVQENSERIISSRRRIKLSEILEVYDKFGNEGRFMTEYLRSYIRSRKEEFFRDYEKKDHISEWDIFEDKNYRFYFQDFEKIFF